VGFTIHWINQNTLEGLIVGECLETIPMTYDNIAEMIDKVLPEFNVENKTTLILSSNAASFVSLSDTYSTYYNLISITFMTNYIWNA